MWFCHSRLLIYKMPKQLFLNSKENVPSAKVGSRFKFDVSDQDVEDHCHGFMPTATAQDTQKCMNLFEEWVKERNRLYSNDKVPENILFFHDKMLLCKWLCGFGIEKKGLDTLSSQDAPPLSCRFTASHSAKGQLQHHQHHKRR